MFLSSVSVNTFAASAHSTLTVSAIVLPVTRVQQNIPKVLSISATDVARGYIDVTEPVGLHIVSNSNDGFAVDVLPTNNLFSHVVMRGLGNDVALGMDGGMIVQRWQHAQTMSINLQFKFALQPNVQPGDYAFPLHMNVRAL